MSLKFDHLPSTALLGDQTSRAVELARTSVPNLGEATLTSLFWSDAAGQEIAQTTNRRNVGHEKMNCGAQNSDLLFVFILFFLLRTIGSPAKNLSLSKKVRGNQPGSLSGFSLKWEEGAVR